jgi:hypothetical protein
MEKSTILGSTSISTGMEKYSLFDEQNLLSELGFLR